MSMKPFPSFDQCKAPRGHPEKTQTALQSKRQYEAVALKQQTTPWASRESHRTLLCWLVGGILLTRT
jgi:hypothetical protein